ncbi:MAG: hypothetical protein V4456_11740 [Bacteroidota bacterium]
MEDKNDLTQQQYSFALKRIQLLEKNLAIVAKRENDDSFDFEIAMNIKVDEGKHLSIHMFAIKVKSKPDNRILASLSIVCVFEIFNFENVFIPNATNTGLPQGLLNLLNTVVIGTMRGVMFSEFRGTALDNAILPVLDPTRFERGE